MTINIFNLMEEIEKQLKKNIVRNLEIGNHYTAKTLMDLLEAREVRLQKHMDPDFELPFKRKWLRRDKQQIVELYESKGIIDEAMPICKGIDVFQFHAALKEVGYWMDVAEKYNRKDKQRSRILRAAGL